MSKEQSIQFDIPEDVHVVDLFGTGERYLRLMQESFDATISVFGNRVNVSGSAAELLMVKSVIDALVSDIQAGNEPSFSDVERAIDLVKNPEFADPLLKDDVILKYHGRSIRPKTMGQKHYIDAMRHATIAFGLGPAGTGKTFLAMAMALDALHRKEVGRIILSRPIVEAGENLGFLPGTLEEKVDPYIRPLYDALFEMCDADEIRRLIECGTIEIVPLAFMRGRTLSDSFIILDEAQNSTPEQMKMFLTRLGFGSHMVVTGDMTQSDLGTTNTGLARIEEVLGDVPGIEFVHLTGKDVVRNSLVARIIAAYECSQA